MTLELITPDWPAPKGVRALTTTRLGGVSCGPYASLNLGDHVGDDPAAVVENRRRLRQALSLPAEPLWLRQVHGTCAADTASALPGCEADASYARAPGEVCVVMTADCLPLLLCNDAGSEVAAVHAGWRGLLAGVIEQTVSCMGGGELLAWLGPAIGPAAFEVGGEVREAFITEDQKGAVAFAPGEGGRWFADLYRLARQRLARCGVHQVYGGDLCTFSDAGRFYSYRRDGVTGRMASLIWLEE